MTLLMALSHVNSHLISHMTKLIYFMTSMISLELKWAPLLESGVSQYMYGKPSFSCHCN